MPLFDLLAHSPALLLGFTAVLGLIVGSFLNVVIHRLPIMLQRDWRGECRELLALPAEAPEPALTLATPRSRCPQCQTPIAARDNIPLLSYLLLRGRCRHCGARISPRYPAVELLTALLSVAVVWQFGPTWAALAALALTWSLIALALIDLDHQLLPDNITLPVLWLGLLISLGALFADTASALIGAAAGYLVLWAFYQAFKLLTGKEGMGYGDFKLLAMLGAWLGWQQLPVIVILSSLVGAVVGLTLILALGRDRQLPIPFGPYLAAAGWLALMWGEDLTGAYLRWAGIG